MKSRQAPNAEQLRARVLEAVQREPAATRASYGQRRALGIAGGFAFSAAVAGIEGASKGTVESARAWHVVAEGGVPHQPAPTGYGATIALAWLVISVLSTWGGVMRGRSLIGRSARIKAAVAGLTPLALLTTWFAARWVWVESTDDPPALSVHATCAAMGLVYAVGPLIAFVAFRRTKDPLTPRLSAAAAGAAAGAWGALVQFPFCDCTSALHVALGHVLPVAGLAGLGFVVGSRLFGVHPMRPAET